MNVDFYSPTPLLFVAFVLENAGVDVDDNAKEFDALDSDMFVPVLGLWVDVGSGGDGGGGDGEVVFFGKVVLGVGGGGGVLVVLDSLDFEVSITIFLI